MSIQREGEGKALITRSRIEQIVHNCLDELFENDLGLLQNDVSERAITHKFAEYLQDRIPNLNVDCEYNRNFELGERANKRLYFLKANREGQIKVGLQEDDLLAISTYPDIIVHRRMTNAENLLIIEVKKKNSQVSHDHDHEKLEAFTDTSDRNPYHYKYGVFILLDTGTKKPKRPKLTWFVEGKMESKKRTK